MSSLQVRRRPISVELSHKPTFYESLSFGFHFGLALTLFYGLSEIRHILRHPEELFTLIPALSFLTMFSAACWQAVSAWLLRTKELLHQSLLAGFLSGVVFPVVLSGFRLLDRPLSLLTLAVVAVGAGVLAGRRARSQAQSWWEQGGLAEVVSSTLESFLNRFGYGSVIPGFYTLEGDLESVFCWVRRVQSQQTWASVWGKRLLISSLVFFFSVPLAVWWADTQKWSQAICLIPFALSVVTLVLAGFCYLQFLPAKAVMNSARLLEFLCQNLPQDSSARVQLDLGLHQPVMAAEGLVEDERVWLVLEVAEGELLKLQIAETVRMESRRATFDGDGYWLTTRGSWSESAFFCQGEGPQHRVSGAEKKVTEGRSNGVEDWNLDVEEMLRALGVFLKDRPTV